MRAFRYMGGYWVAAVGQLLCMLLATAGMLLIPRMQQIIIDRGIVTSDLNVVILFAVLMVGLALVRGVFQFGQGALAARVSNGVSFDLRNDVYAKIQSLSFGYHDRTHTGQLLTRATSDVDRVQGFIGQGAIMLVSALLMIVGSFVLLFSLNARLAGIVLIMIPLTLVLFAYFARSAMPLFGRVQRKLDDLNTVLQENFAGIRLIKAFVREAHEAERYDRVNREFYDLNIQVNNVLSMAFPSIFGVLNIATLVIYWSGGLQVIAGTLTLGELVAFASYLMTAFFPILMIGFIVSMLSSASASAGRIFELLDAESDVVERPDAQPLPPVKGRIAFEDVTFQYVHDGDPVLSNVSFVAEPGQSVALLGTTGSGKSTIINLIPRFYDVRQGRVTVDGYDIRDVTLESLRNQIGIVLQETNLFEGTIRENITFGSPQASADQVEEAARAAEAHDFIIAFPQGYDTHVGERGVNLSGGQKQRIAIARALLLDPAILILDDATSSVDLATENRIQKALDRLMEGRTSLIVAQRVATVVNADQILVLDRGRIVARGKHQDLIESSELYAEIYCSQLQERRTLQSVSPEASEFAA
ncbi:MAG: ABC transporter ATP-binding protein [Anaerolineae bacterium]